MHNVFGMATDSRKSQLEVRHCHMIFDGSYSSHYGDIATPVYYFPTIIYLFSFLPIIATLGWHPRVKDLGHWAPCISSIGICNEYEK